MRVSFQRNRFLCLRNGLGLRWRRGEAGTGGRWREGSRAEPGDGEQEWFGVWKNMDKDTGSAAAWKPGLKRRILTESYSVLKMCNSLCMTSTRDCQSAKAYIIFWNFCHPAGITFGCVCGMRWALGWELDVYNLYGVRDTRREDMGITDQNKSRLNVPSFYHFIILASISLYISFLLLLACSSREKICLPLRAL